MQNGSIMRAERRRGTDVWEYRASRNPDAWDAALQFVNYKSLNNRFVPSLPDLNSLPDVTAEPAFRDKYLIMRGKTLPTFALKGYAPAKMASQSGYIGEDRNKDLVIGPAWQVIEGGDVDLDGLEMRNIVFRNVHVSYSGGPLVIHNLFFVDCTFNMTIDEQTKRLALAILGSSSSTTFSGE